MMSTPCRTYMTMGWQSGTSTPCSFIRTPTRPTAPLGIKQRRLVVKNAAARADLSVEVNGLVFENPFVTGSGPPGTNYAVMKKAFEEGWGGVIAKTVSLDSEKVKNVTPRYAKMRGHGREVIGWENIELISDRPLEVMLEDFVRLKREYPDKILIASIMEEYNKEAWDKLV